MILARKSFFAFFILLFLPLTLVAAEHAKSQLLIQTKTKISQPVTINPNSSEKSMLDPILGKYRLKYFSLVVEQSEKGSSNKFKVLSNTDANSNTYVYKLIFKENDIDITTLINEFQNNSNVIRVQPNFIYKAFLVPNDTHYDKQWNMPFINAENGWNVTRGEQDIVVAVIDTGVDWEHNDLKNNIWINEYETVNGQDSDGNGYIDDIRGWDFRGTTVNSVLVPENNPMDEDGHGTHVAGIIAAELNNSFGIAGVAANCSIMPLRSGTTDELYTADIISAVNYAVANGAKVINMSLGASGVQDNLLEQTVKQAIKSNVLVIAAAGNDEVDMDYVPYIPASYAGVMTVSATRETKSTTNYSNYGSCIDIAAPGGAGIGENDKDILSTYLDQQFAYGYGTSMAAPHIAGAAALLFSYYPAASTQDVYFALTTSAEDLGDNGKDDYFGYGLLNVKDALTALETRLASVDTVEPEGFGLYGPNGKDSPIVNSPNPFDPEKQTTSICFQTNEFAQISIYIYSLNLQRVFYSSIYSNGYDTEIWDGRDQNGDLVPNGVYILIIQAEANGKKIIRRNKIAVLRT
jgi:subtilisin family serine protease